MVVSSVSMVLSLAGKPVGDDDDDDGGDDDDDD